MNTVNVNPNDLLRSHVKDYVPSIMPAYFLGQQRRPILTQLMVQEMLVDPRVMFGLWLIKGPIISKARFNVVCDNEAVADYTIKTINRFWHNGVVQALKAIEWGYSGSETLYEQDETERYFIYKGLKDFESPSVRVVTKHGERTGILVNNFMTAKMEPGRAVYIGGPKAFHHIHRRECHPWYGRSRLNGPHLPWYEFNSEGGYRDIRRLWFYKNAFEGGIIYHPEGHIKRPTGTVVSCQDYAQEMIEKKRSGATLTLPSKTNNGGQKLWEYVPAKGNTIPAGLFDYEQALRIEILEGMGIPYEVIEASGNEGFGSSTGRQIPETAFYAILQEELNWLMYDFLEQIIRPMIRFNAAQGLLPYATVEVLAFPLETSSMVENGETQITESEDVGSDGGTKPFAPQSEGKDQTGKSGSESERQDPKQKLSVAVRAA